MTPSEPESRRWNAELVVIALLLAVCLVIYGQTLWFDFINLDDNLYVYQNPAVVSGLSTASVKWAFTTFHSANWHPLTWLSHMFDATLFGMKPGALHFVNVIFHAANSILVFVVFSRLTGDTWKSAVVGFLFAVHPAHVESVAWISERKDVLSTLFWLLTMLAYERYARAERNIDGTNESALSMYRSPGYLLALLFFTLGLMAKPMLVTVPFVLLLVDFWPLGRLRKTGDLGRLLLEKAPFFVLSLVSCIVTIVAQNASGALKSFQDLSITDRFLNTLTAYLQYVLMLFYPHDLAVWYPAKAVGMRLAAAAGLMLLAISIICVWQSPTRRYLLFGWLWFLGTLVPVIGLVQVGGQSMADRYTYVPFLGLFVMVVWAGAEVLEGLRLNVYVRAAIPTIAILAMMSAAYVQTRYWRDSETLYVRTLNVTSDNFLIAHNLCYVYVFSNRYAEAEPLCEGSIKINPNYPDSQNTLGILRLKQDRYSESELAFRKVLAHWPGYLPAYANLAAALVIEQKPEEAEKYLEAATVISEGSMDRSTWIEPVKNLADLYASQNKKEKAVENYRRAVFLDPDRLDFRLAAASAMYDTHEFDDALKNIQAAMTIDQNNADAFYIAGNIFTAKGMRKDAETMYKRAIEIRPDFAEAQSGLLRLKGATKND